MDLRIEPATPETWPAVCTVMATPGDPEACWCQAFRHSGPEFQARSVDDNRSDLERQVASGQPPGLVAWDGDEPVGWCAVAPLEDLTRMTGAPLSDLRPDDDDLDGRWVVSCFIVRPPARGTGLLPRLLDAAVEHARSRGARSVEGYPLDPGQAETIDPEELFAGLVGHWERAGFARVVRLGPTRHLVSRRLD